MPLYTPTSPSNVTEYMFAFPGGDIGTWHADDGTALDTYSYPGMTFSSSIVEQGPAGYSMKVEIESPNQDYFCTPVFPVTPGDILEWGITMGNPAPVTEGPVYLDNYYPLWWETADPDWSAGYTDYGSYTYWKVPDVSDTDVIFEHLPGNPGVFTGSAVVPADRVQASIEFGVQPVTGAADPVIFYVHGCWVRVTTPSAIT